MGSITVGKWEGGEDSGFSAKREGKAKDKRKRELKQLRAVTGEPRRRRRIKDRGGYWE